MKTIIILTGILAGLKATGNGAQWTISNSHADLAQVTGVNAVTVFDNLVARFESQAECEDFARAALLQTIGIELGVKMSITESNGWEAALDALAALANIEQPIANEFKPTHKSRIDGKELIFVCFDKAKGAKSYAVYADKDGKEYKENQVLPTAIDDMTPPNGKLSLMAGRGAILIKGV